MIGIPSSALRGQGQFNGLGFSILRRLLPLDWGLISFLSLTCCHSYGTGFDGKDGKTTSPMILVMPSYTFAFGPGQGQCLLLNM